MSEVIPQVMAGKILTLRTGASGGSGVVLSGVRFETIGGRLFVVGIVPSGVVPGIDRNILAIAWDQVQEFYVFDTVEELKAARNEWKKFKPATQSP